MIWRWQNETQHWLWRGGRTCGVILCNCKASPIPFNRILPAYKPHVNILLGSNPPATLYKPKAPCSTQRDTRPPALPDWHAADVWHPATPLNPQQPFSKVYGLRTASICSSETESFWTQAAQQFWYETLEVPTWKTLLLRHSFKTSWERRSWDDSVWKHLKTVFAVTPCPDIEDMILFGRTLFQDTRHFLDFFGVLLLEL